MSKLRKPCENCPWRRDAPPKYWHPDHFRSIWQNCQDDGLRVMQCHRSATTTAMLVCQGWARVLGTDAIGVRIALLQGDLTIEETNDVDGFDLFTFEEMMVANDIELPPRNKWSGR